jgi:hypothetical protein
LISESKTNDESSNVPVNKLSSLTITTASSILNNIDRKLLLRKKLINNNNNETTNSDNSQEVKIEDYVSLNNYLLKTEYFFNFT